MKNVELSGPIVVSDESQNLTQSMAIVIDGSTLTYAIESDAQTRSKFFRLSLLASSVICCRVSPKQKADVQNYFNLPLNFS